MNKNSGAWLLAAFVFGIAVAHCSSAKAGTIGVMGGHWGHHWLSEDITNERHRLMCLRVDYVQGCSFDNSYRQPGFSGESYSLGIVHDFPLWSNVNRWNGDVVFKGSVGATYGYTTFAGHDWSDKDIHGYVAGGPFYRQLIKGTNGKWEVGVLQFGDDSIPSAGLLWEFDLF